VALGIGTGESLNEVPSSGMVWPAQKERTARFKEAVELIRRLWSEDRLSYEGEFYRTEKATIYDWPEQPVPLYIAAAGPFMAKFAGEQGDGFICTSGKKWELYTETLLPNVATGLLKNTRRPASFDRMIEIKLSLSHRKRRSTSNTRWKWKGWPMRCRWNAQPHGGS
jgi:coenzyme F420-dependent glucose-6-phosphate dehydrogenase